MTNRSRILIASVIGILALSAPARAHHGATNVYDFSKPVMLKGTITKFEWLNPHNQIYFDVTDEKGVVSHWIAAMLRHAKPGGRLSLIHKAERLPDILQALGSKAGGIRIVPLQSRAGEAAKRIIVSAIKGSRAPLVLAPGLVLHGDDGGYRPEIEAMLRDGAAFPG